MSDKKTRIAFIGCGNITGEHIPAWKELAAEAEIVAGCDIVPEKLKVFMERTGLPESAVYDDWKKLLEEVKPDVVDICLPNYLHCPAALDAFKAGCHVYCEKPLAMNAAECEQMIAAAKAANKKLAVGFQQEYCPNTKLLVRARDEGFFGPFRYVQGQLMRRHGCPHYGVFNCREKGGGPIMDIAVHLVDLITHVLGRPKPLRVTATLFENEGKREDFATAYGPFCGWGYKDYNVEDLAAFQVNFEGGAVLQLVTSYVTHIKEDCVYDFRITGTDGGAHWASGKDPELYCDRFGAMMNMQPNWMPSLGRPDMFRRKLDNFLQAVRTGSELQLPGEIGLYVQRILDAVFESARLGREITL